MAEWISWAALAALAILISADEWKRYRRNKQWQRHFEQLMREAEDQPTPTAGKGE